MKKLILSLGMMGLGFSAMSQVIFRVEEPASIEGFYDFSSNGEGSSWGLANLNGVYVLDTVVMADDGTPGLNAQGNPASATGCNALPAGSLAGKIAMVFRGDGGSPAIGACGFGVKVQNCQNAGAIAVIIVNREEATVAMNGGTEGAATNIPVVSVNLSTGVAIKNAIANGDDVIAFIGDKTGYFPNDISIFDNSTLRADFGSMPAALAQNASELSIPLGAMVYNYGQNDQVGITLHTTISNGSTVYDETSTSFDLVAGDSMWVAMPAFSNATYPVGHYTVTNALEYGVTDDFTEDNVSESGFDINDNLWSWARLDDATIVGKDNNYRLSTLPTATFGYCTVYKNANASRLATDGIYYGGVSTQASDSIDLTGIPLDVYLFEWDDVYTSTQDATFNLLTQVNYGTYEFTEDLQDSTIFIPFTDEPVYQLSDDQNYLLCVNSSTMELFHATDTKTIYDRNQTEVDMPRFPINSDDTYNALGFGLAPSIAMHVDADLSVSEAAIQSEAFPNPSKDIITVKVNAASGDATLKVTDMAGRVVSTQNVKLAGGKFTTNVAEMNAGTYVFSLEFANGTSSRFNVVVTK